MVKVDFGKVGLWSAAPTRMSATEAKDFAAEVEDLGYPTLWYPESVGGKESIGLGALLLSWTSGMRIASGISNIAARDPMAMASGARMLADAFPGRFVLGIGASTDLSLAMRGAEYAKPYSRVVAYLDGMGAFDHQTPDPAEPVALVLAALGPRMLKLAAERSLGAHSYFVPAEHTAFARQVLGNGPVLAPELPFLVCASRDEARQVAGSHMEFYLSRRPYADNMRRLGFSEEDLQGSGSDRLFDSIVAWGSADDVQRRVVEHLDAGADHVCIEPMTPTKSRSGLDQIRQVTPAMLEI
ncbi:MAG: TIGR03620 family F420-dependent LLM class oxidoreductase [Acidimicrobiia bacterium]